MSVHLEASVPAPHEGSPLSLVLNPPGWAPGEEPDQETHVAASESALEAQPVGRGGAWCCRVLALGKLSGATWSGCSPLSEEEGSN